MADEKNKDKKSAEKKSKKPQAAKVDRSSMNSDWLEAHPLKEENK